MAARLSNSIALALVSTLVARTAFAISYRLGFYPEIWLADLTMGMLSNDVAFWIALLLLAVAVWVGLEFGVGWLRTNRLRKALIAVNNEGVAILNDGNLTTQVGAWTFKFSDWHRRILQAAESYSPELRNHLEPIKRFTVKDESVAVDDPTHKVNVRIVAEVMHRVDAWLAMKAKR